MNPIPSDRLRQYRIALQLVTSLFFMWGLAYGLLDVLNKHFQETMGITRARSGLLQAAYFGAYFVMARPASVILKRRGFKTCILVGLMLYAIGALGFVPATLAANFGGFLAAVFVLASGLAHLETAANPYVVLLGDRQRAELRLNLSQSFNGLGAFLGPLIGGVMFFRHSSAAGPGTWEVQITYVAIGVLALLVAILVWRTPLPEFTETGSREATERAPVLLRQPKFVAAVVAQFFYVAAQVGVGTYFINYVTEQHTEISDDRASYLLSMGLLLFTIGRFLGVALMRFIAPASLLLVYALVSCGLCIIVASGHGSASLAALIAVFFFMSIMFPTIFALGVADLGVQAKLASSYLIMAILGGAIVPYFMGRWADAAGIAQAYWVPAVCFMLVAAYAALVARK
jgi:MFS transporter, FHS family, L-fucose permease